MLGVSDGLGVFYRRRVLRLSLALIIIALLMEPQLIEPFPSYMAGELEEGEYVYYGYAPSSSQTPEIGDNAYLDIVGVNDTTRVYVYDLVRGKEIWSGVLNRMELKSPLIPFETYFKVVSDKPIAASISGGRVYSFGGNTFYPATSRGFVGKEFIFMALPTAYTHIIFAFEDSEVKIFNATGAEQKRLKLSSYSYAHHPKDFFFAARSVYRVVSTGNIMISTWTGNAITFLPSATGGFVGRIFFGAPIAWFAGSIMVFAYEDSSIRAIDLASPAWFMALWPTVKRDLKAGRYFYQKTEDRRLLIESTGDISVLCGDTQDGDDPKWFGDDIAIAATRPNQEFHFYAPTKAIIFAYKDTSATIDGYSWYIPKDTFIELGPGYHTLKADETLIIQVVGTGIVPPGFDDWGSCLLAPQDVEVSHTVPKPPQRDFTVYPIIGGPIVAAALLTAFIWVKRRRRRLAKLQLNP